MAVNKVVYGTTVLVDLTSDTVDAAHLAKGRTAHDAGGNLIVGDLEQQGSGNLLSGVTPSLLNGATQNGKTYVIPNGGRYGTDYLEYQLDIPTLTSDTAYCVIVCGNTVADGLSLSVNLYHQTQYGEISYDHGSLYWNTFPSATSDCLKLTSGAKPTKLVICGNGRDSSVNIYNVTLVALDL